MKQVWKFPIPIDDEINIRMPRDALLVKVGQQNGEGQLWAVVDPAEPMELRRFWVRGTGHDITGAAKYVGTFETHNSKLVWHLFEPNK